MEVLDELEALVGRGTSMVSLAVGTNPRAYDDACSLLKQELSVAANIKSRV